jgi:hypothetical protein
MNKQSLLTAAVCALVFASNTIAQPQCSAVSGSQTNALVELYTSEGCSSCPPADQWLTRLKTQSNQLGNIVPIALHVDYWDYIGWKDNFANPAFAKRQRDMAASGRARGVYTPQIAINGQDTRSWLANLEFGFQHQQLYGHNFFLFEPGETKYFLYRSWICLMKSQAVSLMTYYPSLKNRF